MIISNATRCKTGFYNLLREHDVGGFDTWTSIIVLSHWALSRPAKHTLGAYQPSMCHSKAHIDYYRLQEAPCITEWGLRITLSPDNWVHSGVNVKLFASYWWAEVFFSISLMWQSYSFQLCANSYWIFIKTQTNSNRCAFGNALKNQFAKQHKITPIIVSLDRITRRRWFSFECE